MAKTTTRANKANPRIKIVKGLGLLIEGCLDEVQVINDRLSNHERSQVIIGYAKILLKDTESYLVKAGRAYVPDFRDFNGLMTRYISVKRNFEVLTK